MPEFGSFSLLLALVLSGYTLLAGGVALRQLATGSRGRMAPDRRAETARRAGIGRFFAVHRPAFARKWLPLPPALPGVCGLQWALRVCPGRVDDALSGGKVDPHYPPLDHGD